MRLQLIMTLAMATQFTVTCAVALTGASAATVAVAGPTSSFAAPSIIARSAAAQRGGADWEPDQVVHFQRIRNRALCLRLLPRLRNVCDNRNFTEADVLVAIFDFNRDRMPDVLVRYRSIIACGTRGCQTELYLGTRRDAFVNVGLDVVSHGSVSPCNLRTKPGIRFSTSESRHCFPIARD